MTGRSMRGRRRLPNMPTRMPVPKKSDPDHQRPRTMEYETPGVRVGGLATRGNAILVCAMVLLLTVVMYAGDAWVQVLSVLFGDGIIALLWVAAATMLGWVIL